MTYALFAIFSLMLAWYFAPGVAAFRYWMETRRDWNANSARAAARERR